MKAIHMLAAGLILLATGAQATDFTLKEGVSGLFDWTDGNNYVGGEAPQQKDLSATDRDAVIVPEGVTVVISNVMPNASLALINSLARIRPAGYRTRIVFAVEKDKELTLDCAVNYDGYTYNADTRGILVKDGEGLLYLSAQPSRYAYKGGKNYYDGFLVNLEVNAGILKFNQAADKPDSYFSISRVFVAEGATWYPPCPGQVNIAGLSGGGTIMNERSGEYQYVRVVGGTDAAPQEFSGRALGMLSLGFLEKTYINLTGTNSTSRGTFDVEGNYFVDGGRIGIRKFGKYGEPSTTGVMGNNINLASRNGFWLTSFRQPDDPIDETDKNILLFSGNGLGRAVLDGGAVGGVKFIGSVFEHSTSPGQKIMMLTGSNTTEECVMASKFTRVANPSYPTSGYSVYLIKRGSGIWRMGNDSSQLSGAIAVEDGTLRYDSIANRGTASSLGTAFDLYRPVDAHGVALTEDDQVGYAFLLGDGTDAHEGNLEYAGLNDVVPVKGRPLAVNGKGRLTNGTAKNFNFTDVYTVGTGDNVLTLDGDDLTANNVISGLDDRKEASGGNLTVVKDGNGTWQISGTNDIHGALVVKKGVLVLKNKYTYFRWNFKASQTVNISGSTASDALGTAADEFGLYAADGTRLNKGFEGVTGVEKLAAGKVAPGFATTAWTPKTGDGSNVANLCDDTTAVLSQWYYPNGWSWYNDDGTAYPSSAVQHWFPNQPTTWFPIVMQLSEDSLAAVGYDVAANAGKPYPAKWSVDASVDGAHWDEVAADVDVPNLSANNQWHMAKRAHVAGQDDVHTNAQGVADMALFERATPIAEDEFLAHVASVRVDAGGTLKVRAGGIAFRGLTIDCSGVGAGTIDGGTFAASGSIDVTGMAKDVKSMTVKFNLVSTSGFGNVANWTLKENGVPTAKLSASVNEDGTITIRRAGLLLLVR